MELFLFTQSRYYNGSSKSRNFSSRFISMLKKVGLLVCGGEPFDDEAHIVFSTRNLTKSITGITKIPPTVGIPNANPKLGNNSKIRIPPHLLERPCLLSTHGLRRRSRSSMSLEEVEETLHVLPMTVCTKHGVTSFLPLDYVKRMAEYTCTTRIHPVFEVVHRYDDCVLEFPFPPPIGSSEEETIEIDFSKNCYQCFTPITERSTVFMFRDYLFCCNMCRMRACVSMFWYETMMSSCEKEEEEEEEGIDFDDDQMLSMEKEAIFSILS